MNARLPARLLVTAAVLGAVVISAVLPGQRPASAATASVDIGDNFFRDVASNGTTTTITAGDTVTWTWRGSNPHSVASTSSESFGSATQTSGTFSHTFNTPGTYTYLCGVHGAAMPGTIVVQAQQATATNTAQPTSTPATPTTTPAPSVSAAATATGTRAAPTPTVAASSSPTVAAPGAMPAATRIASAAAAATTGAAALPRSGAGNGGGGGAATWLAVVALAGVATVATGAGVLVARRR